MEFLPLLSAVLFIIGPCTPAQATDLSTTTAEFALNFLKASTSHNENAFFSPASISMCVGMVYVGAKGKTKEQIKSVFYNGLSDEEIKAQMRVLASTLNMPTESYNLSTANRLLKQRGFKILATYLNDLTTYFMSDIQTVDFVRNAEIIRQAVNKWVEYKTNSKIKDLIPPGAFEGPVRLVLVNAIYFKSNWQTMFNANETSKKPFHVSENDEIQIDMMKQRNSMYFYNENNNVRLLGVPYKNATLAFYVVLPKQRFGLKKLEANFNGAEFSSLVRSTTTTESFDEVQIPKFRMEKSTDLKRVLQSMNVIDLFTYNSTLSGIDGENDTFVSGAFHKAFIEVNEEGSEAAAATAIVINGIVSVGFNEPKIFIVDQPFIFAIVDRRTWSTLFFGRFVRN